MMIDSGMKRKTYDSPTEVLDGMSFGGATGMSFGFRLSGGRRNLITEVRASRVEGVMVVYNNADAFGRT